MKYDKSKKIKLIIVIAIPVIILILMLVFFLSLVKDKSDSKEAMKVIRKDYEVFSNQVVEFNNYRDSIYDEVFNNSNYDSLKENREANEKKMSEYEKLVDKITKDSKKLYKYCDGILYTDRDVNTMCKTFGNDYETLYNSFIVDTKNYNTLIKEFNKYVKENNLEDTEMEKYTTKKKYIDYNKDKKYSGKE